MRLAHHLENKTCIVSLEGDIQFNEIVVLEDGLKPILEDRSITNFIINFENAELLSSAGIVTILLFQRLLNDRQSKLVLCELSTGNWEMMNICGLNETLSIYPTMQDAREALMV